MTLTSDLLIVGQGLLQNLYVLEGVQPNAKYKNNSFHSLRIKVQKKSSSLKDGQTDPQTDGRTDGPPDKHSLLYRVIFFSFDPIKL